MEVEPTQALAGTDIVGLPDKAVQESRSRVQAAVKNARLRYPRERIVVNLAPASVRKEGPTYDLPIAVGVLLMQALVPANSLDDSLVVGELIAGGDGTPLARGAANGSDGAAKGVQEDPRSAERCARSRAHPAY